MAYQKLQTERANLVVPSDTIDIPDPGLEIVSSTDTAGTSSKLTDTSQNFNDLNVRVGDIIHNTTDDTIATVTAIDSDTVLSISANIMANTEKYTLFSVPNKPSACALYVGTAGDATCYYSRW